MIATGCWTSASRPSSAPLRQTAGASTTLEIQFASCTAPVAGTSCSANGAITTSVALTQTTGTCLEPIPGTVVHNYSPIITLPTGPCYVSPVISTFNVALTGIAIPMRDTRIAATYVGDPATSTIQGLLYGFVSEAFAMTANVPEMVPGIGGQPSLHALSRGRR